MESPIYNFGEFYTVDGVFHASQPSSHLSIPSPFMSSHSSPAGTPSPGPPSPWHPSTLSVPRTAEAMRAPTSAAVAAACLACRGKHLKCDGKAPCGRCRGTASECVYVASRRGYKGPRRSPTASPPKSQASTAVSCSRPDASPTIPTNTTTAVLPLFQYQDTRPHQHATPYDMHALFANRCLDSFYHNYHATNPFLPPKACLLRFAQSNQRGGLGHVLNAARWIGSLYTSSGDAGSRLFFEEACRLSHPDTTKYIPNGGDNDDNAWLLQALLLLTLGLDLISQPDRARAMFSRAEVVMAQIALYPRPFGASHGDSANIKHNHGGVPLLDECWNRTCMAYFTLGAAFGVESVQIHEEFAQSPGFEQGGWAAAEGLCLAGVYPVLFGQMPEYFDV